MKVPAQVTPKMVEGWQILALGTSVRDTAAKCDKSERTILGWRKKLKDLSVTQAQALPAEVQAYYKILTCNPVPPLDHQGVTEISKHHDELRRICSQLLDEITPPDLLFSFPDNVGNRGIHRFPRPVGGGFLYAWQVDRKGVIVKLLPLTAVNPDCETQY